MPLVIELRDFLPLSSGEEYYKGYMAPGKPGWARILISKKRADGLIESANYVVFTNPEGKLFWHKHIVAKLQSAEEFDRDLEEFRAMLEGAGLLIFIEDYQGEP
jgi:hypothetical protein